ncbi:MAG: DUF502 domain-containing protein [Chlamydiae bacterium]|nr:DUF502 domain-containing protein [Chlamydiota bacterium]
MKKYLITGLIILMPLVLTIMLIVFLVDFFTTPVISLVGQLVVVLQEKLSFHIPQDLTLFVSRIIALILICTLIFVLGIFSRWFLMRSFLKLIHQIMGKIPVVRWVYKLCREVFSALFATDGKKIFKKPVMTPFPDAPNYCLGFLSGDAPVECEEKLGRPLVSVFAPTAPHPISGFLFILPEEDIKSLDMTNEDAIKFLISCGVILPASDPAQGSIDEHF